MNRLAQIEAALRDMRAALDDQDWDALGAVPPFEPGEATDEPVDPDRARDVLAKVNSMLAELREEARRVRSGLDEQPTFKRAARAYLSASAGTR